jgi:hypothetical protein
MADRPDPSFSWPKIPEGHEVVAVEDKDWRLTPEPKRCRWTSGFSPRRACAEPSVAELTCARAHDTPARAQRRAQRFPGRREQRSGTV